MCGRYAFFDPDDFANRYMVDEDSLDFAAEYNISPGMMSDVVTRNSPNTVRKMKWGLIPAWSKEFKMTFRTFNARIEGLKTSPIFRRLIKKRRCLIPANGFFEWTQGNGKTPHYIHCKDQKLFSFAGLYDVWKDVEEKEFYSYTIITTSANSFIKKIHHRMPVILDKKDESTWVDHAIEDEKKIFAVLDQYDSKKMKEYEVSNEVNSGRNQGPQLIEPAIKIV